MDIEARAARLEAEQAQRDYSEAHRAFQGAVLADEPAYGSPLDYAVWSTASYADSALRAAALIQSKVDKAKRRALSPANFIRMNDGVKGKRGGGNGSVVNARALHRRGK